MELRKFHNKNAHNFTFTFPGFPFILIHNFKHSPNIVKTVKSRNSGTVGHELIVEENR